MKSIPTMMTYRLLMGLCLLAACLSNTQAQDAPDKAQRALLFNFGYGPQTPAADLADRFGMNFAMEISSDYLSANNWIVGVQGQYLFGNTVKQDVLAGLRTAEGYIIGNDREPANIQLRQRGYYLGLRAGKLIGLVPRNPRSGIRVHLGAGLLSHRIRIQEDPIRAVAPLTGDYAKGYDRLTAGLALHQFIGYQVISKANNINLMAGFEAFEGFTSSQRSFDFDTASADTAQRLDVLLGFRVAITLPLYLLKSDEIYY